MQQLRDTGVYFPDDDRHFMTLKGGNPQLVLNYQLDRVAVALRETRFRRVAVDVGAHVGLLTRKLAEMFERVISFEPDPRNFECLEANTRKFKNVTLYNKALGEQPGLVSMDRQDLANTGNRQVVEGGKIERVTLDSLRLEELDLLKIDVQGYECYVLEGATKTLRYCRPTVILEVEKEGALPLSYEKTAKQGAGVLKRLGASKVAELSADQIWAFSRDEQVPFDKYEAAGPYHWRKYENAVSVLNMLDTVVGTVKSGKHRSILDVGCGDGLYASLIGPQVYGIDVNAKAIEYAKQYKVPCQQLSVFDVDKLGRKFDAVCLFDVLEHLYDQKRCIEMLGRITSRIYLLNPDPGAEEQLHHYHSREFTAAELVAWMQGIGWVCRQSVSLRQESRNGKTLLVFDRK